MGMSTNPTPARSRRPAGTPTGGQFAPETHAEPEVTLGAPELESIPETDGNGDTFWRSAGGQLHRTDGPAIEWADGDREWWVDGQLHREDGPAIEYANGTREWWVHGQRHRIEGPAVERADGGKEWWANGVHLTEDQFRTAHERAIEAAFTPQVMAAFLAASERSGLHLSEANLRAAAEQFLDSSDSDEFRSAYRAAVDRILYRAETGITGPLPTTPEAAKRARDLGK